MAVRKCASVALLALLGCAAANEVDCGSMKSKELKQFLARKGKKCEGCAEKADFVQMCEQSVDLPDLPEEQQPTAHKAKGKSGASADDGKEKSIDDILASLKGMPGMDNIKVFRPGDLDDMLKRGDLGDFNADGKEGKEEL
ncbi:hypothetical protein KFE25_007382 [Diacronema lutheri]|uniref:ARMET C-terminal domain-containing protein n=1 Tax=Diacronema lutheri TaxID=2081491 RepID=A0A8J6CDR1_DIALT|nr:hypothetical protein KFE25_007382 [Diacronema lutheri]